MYRFINANQIQPYDGSILKQYEDDKLVKVVSNPTEEQLKEFGYKKLVNTPMPTPSEGHYYAMSYIDGEEITMRYEEKEVEGEE